MEDSAIMQLYRERDEAAIAATAEKYGAYCLTVAERILGSREDAEECVNQAYWNAWNSIPPHHPEKLSAYLGKIVRNLAFNLYKEAHAEKRGAGQMMAALDELSEVLADTESVEDVWDSRQLAEAIRAFLAKQPEQKRKIFVCRYWYGDSVQEIAGNFGLTESHVSVILHRLRKKLHNDLTESGFV